jgi:hypothetical protein
LFECVVPADLDVTVSPNAGELPAGAKQRLRVAFQPKLPSSHQKIDGATMRDTADQLKAQLRCAQIPFFSIVKPEDPLTATAALIQARDTVYLDVEAAAVVPSLVCSDGVDGVVLSLTLAS